MIVILPQHVGESNAGQIREELLWVINRGATELVIDTTGTISCDYEGAVAVARATFPAERSGDGQVSASELPGPLRHFVAHGPPFDL